MEPYKKLEIMKSRYDNFAKHERAYYHTALYYYDRYFIDNKTEDMSDHVIEACWDYSRLGAEWKKNLGTAVLLLKDKDRMEEILKKVATRKQFYSKQVDYLRKMDANGVLTASIVNMWLMRIDKTFVT